MRAIFLCLLFFQISIYAQSNTDIPIKKKLYFTLIDNKIPEAGSVLKMKRNEIIDAVITLKGKTDDEIVPPIYEIEFYIPGYPAILIEGSEIDRETALKIEKLKSGNVIVIMPRTEIRSNITVTQIEIID